MGHLNDCSFLKGYTFWHIRQEKGEAMRWFLPILLVLAGCSQPRLFMQSDGEMGIKLNEKMLSVSSNSVLQERVLLSSITIDRGIYALENDHFIAVEFANVQRPYIFRNDARRTLEIVFNAKSTRQLDRVGNLGFYAIVLSDGETLLAVAENLNKLALKLVYGLSKAQMQAVMKHVNAQNTKDFNAIEEVLALDGTKASLLTQWNEKMIIFAELLERRGGKPKNL